MITYEYPLIERVRTLLRLEDLFERAQLSSSSAPTRTSIMSRCSRCSRSSRSPSRAELKSELLQELERQRQLMHALQGNQKVDRAGARRACSRELDASPAGLFNMTGKIGQHLRENDWLMEIKQRTSIPGGACEFDLPHYHQWLHRPSDARLADLHGMDHAALPDPRQRARRARSSCAKAASPRASLAKQGAFQQMLGGQVAQMVRIRLADEAHEVPEISANKYALNVRFTVLGDEPPPAPVETDVDVRADLLHALNS